ncbi:hypothetical protein D8674_007737 [Pyrus ussuriensis x Pyrus communis]|uniref:Uncharacterized protein n=1 Tax=Pyrus ussuriensis x Pyrus communis TaxID=2448454 RepID=A0A5N5HRJ8_9ROSA|nr:hypothetical protein D8674_007737 [Pyrus ussuriensis x Pyrus communis]
MSSNSWREIKIDYLETETTQFWPYCYWMARQKQRKFISYLDRLEQETITKVIALFDTRDEVLFTALFPACFYRPYEGAYETQLGAWNERVALFGFHYLGSSINSFHAWVMDDSSDVRGSSTKHLKS